MKTSKYILIFAMCLLIGLLNTALSHPSVSVSISSGHNDSRSSCRSDYKRVSNCSYRNDYKAGSCENHRSYGYHKSRWGRRKHCNRLRINISHSVYRYDRDLGYCVAVAPMIIERQTIIPVSSSQVVQVQQFDEDTLQLNMELQQKKTELLEQLQRPDKEQRMEAIRELAGFSFDDNVRIALESVLLTEPDAELRKETAQSLGNTNNIKTLAALEKARVEDPNEDVRRAADEAIKKLKGN